MLIDLNVLRGMIAKDHRAQRSVANWQCFDPALGRAVKLNLHRSLPWKRAILMDEAAKIPIDVRPLSL